MLIANDWIDSYFILVSFLLLIPAVIGIIFFWIYYNGEKKKSRMLGVYALALFWITVVLQTGWVCWYYNNFYEQPEVYEGYGDREGGHYRATSKRWYIIRVLFINLTFFFIFFYFFTV